MSDIYKLQYNGMTLAYPGWDGYVAMPPSYRTLTLQTDGHGTLTATTLTGLPGDTVTLTPTYNTYYRFNNYSVTGGTIAGNTFTFGNEDATAQANFKVNYFTARGNFEKGSDVTCNATAAANNAWRYLNVGEKYALHQNHTGDIPSSWYETSNRWKPNDASSYSITLVGKMTLSGSCKVATTAKTTATCLIGDTQSNAQSYSVAYVTNHNPTNATWNYSKTITTTTQDVFYGVSAKLGAYRFNNKGGTHYATAKYIATGTNGTWTATGIAP